MQIALDELYKTHPHMRGQPEDKLMAFIFKYISQPSVDVEKYELLHTSPIVETDIDIDIEQFKTDVSVYENQFTRWGDTHVNYPRFGLPLVNMTGTLDEDVDPSRMPLDEYFMEHGSPDHMPFDHEILEKTEAFYIESLKPLTDVFGEYMCRSAILKWDTMGHFKDHIDVKVPAPNLRLWGTTSNNMQLKMDGKHINNIKPGKIYIFDSSLVHSAHAREDNIYQFFIGLTIDAYDTMMARRI